MGRGEEYPNREGLCGIVLSGFPGENESMSDLRPELLAWTALLGHWIDLVKAGTGMPATGEGEMWQASLEPIITLQATSFALGELGTIDELDRALARDRAEVLIDSAVEVLEATWGAVHMPGTLREIEASAREALQQAVYAGLRWLRWNGPGAWEVPEMEQPDTQGTLAIMQPGTIALPGEPVAWFTERPIPGIDPRLEVVPGEPVQIQRIFEEGVVTHDRITTLDARIIGVPLLVPMSLSGRAIGHFTVQREEWLNTQREAMGNDLPKLVDMRSND